MQDSNPDLVIAALAEVKEFVRQKPPVKRIRFSQVARNQLITLKKRTGIEHYNALARIAFCFSLAESSMPSPVPIPADSNLEMTWEMFGGSEGYFLIFALKVRCQNDGLELTPETLEQHFRWHVHRGIGYLASNPRIRSIESLMEVLLPKMQKMQECWSCSLTGINYDQP